jgi:2-polyprenyl-3-methyl-5-hydroxy-6-metoxy-1,4-benzoquinol methylase
MKCYLCGSTEHSYINGEVRDNPEIKILECNNCGLVFLETQNHINGSFYSDNKMEVSNIKSKVFETSDYMDIERRFKEYYLMFANKSILDFGCGKGSFLTKLKEEGITSKLYALEPNKKYSNYLKTNFTLYENIEEILEGSLDYITLFHVLEHLKDPIGVLNSLYSKLKDEGKIIIEVPNSNDALLKLYGSEAFSRFTYWSCHLYLFNNRTMEDLIKKTAYKIDYIRQYQRYSLANHLYWLAKGKPGGHVFWSFMDDDVMQKIYEKKLSAIGQCDTIVSMISK